MLGNILSSSIFSLIMLDSASLTNVPIDIGHDSKIIPSPVSLTVENSRAALYVELADIHKSDFGKIIAAGMQFPGTDKVKVYVCAGDGKCFELSYAGLALQENKSEIIFTTKWDKTSKVFTFIKIKSEQPFRGVRLRWSSREK